MKAHLPDGFETQLQHQVDKIVHQVQVDDIHTHLYDPSFGGLLLWGLDELLVYHYLVAEYFRHSTLDYSQFWSLPKSAQAERIWDTLFVSSTPLSEAGRGVMTVLNQLGLDPRKSDLGSLRKWFREQKPDAYVNRCMELARVKSICMTNSPFDAEERTVWERGLGIDPRFKCALRIDPLLLQWTETWKRLREMGYAVADQVLSGRNLDQVRRFLSDWTKRMQAQYVMVSLPPSFKFPSDSPSSSLIEKAVLPHCEEFGIPFAVMPGVKRGVNPGLQLAGDGVGTCDLEFLSQLCSGWPRVKFMITALARENQYELAVLARKFRNLHVFGCWWFTNIPSLITEITSLRLELLGTTFTFQHSDARVLDQIIYKWDHSRKLLANILGRKYLELASVGWISSEAEIRRDVELLVGGAFTQFANRGY